MSEEEKTTEQEEQTAAQQQQNEEELKGYLFDLEGSPTKKQVEQWKSIYGEALVSGFSETELYVWRPVKRKEYRDLQQALLNRQQQGEMIDAELEVVKFATLFPANVDWDKTKAGTVSTLHEQILQRSNFFSPQQAAVLVAEL